MTRRRLAHTAITLTAAGAAAWAWHTRRHLRAENRLLEDEATYWWNLAEHRQQADVVDDRLAGTNTHGPRLRAVPTDHDEFVRHVNEALGILRRQGEATP